MKFLVIQTAFIGDVVLATGIIEKLHAHFPEAQIDFMVRKGNESLLTGHPFLHRVLIWDKKQNKLRNLWKMLGTIRRERYDKVINVQRFAATGILTALSGAIETIGFDKNPLSFLFSKKVPHTISNGKHEIERNNELIKHFTNDEAFLPMLHPTSVDFAHVRPYQQNPYIVIAPASVWFTKQYPAEKWKDFIIGLPPGITVHLIGAPGDHDLCELIKKSSAHPSINNLAGKLSFLQSAALQKGAIMNYVNDSAPMHFASAVNAPTTAVYCSTIPAFGFGPLSATRFIVEKPEPLYCRPCGLHGYKACPEGHFRCAHEIRDQQLLEVIRSIGH